MKVLVTGGNGFIGRHTCKRLVDHGHSPVVFDRHQHQPEYEFLLGDIRDATAVTEAMAHVDGFIHLAAVLGTQETINNPLPAAETNILGGINILQGAAQYDVPGVYIGVGNHWMNNSYSITKTTIERFVSMYNKDRGTNINVVRAMNAYGPGQSVAPPFGAAKVRKITPSFACRALKNLPVEIYGDGNQVSDMVYVGDVAEALVRALEYADDGVVFDRAVEVGPEEHLTVNEVAQIIISKSGSQSQVVHLPMRPGEIPGAVVSADTDTLRLVGMSTDDLMPFDIGALMTIEYFRSIL